MNDTIIVALITGGLALIGTIVGTIVTAHSNNQKIIREMKAEFAREMQDTREEFTKEMNALRVEFAASKAATDAHLNDLTQEVRKHNGFADRMPRAEAEINAIKEKIKYLHTDK